MKYRCRGCNDWYEDVLGTRHASPPNRRKGEQGRVILCADCQLAVGITGRDRGAARERFEQLGRVLA